MNKWTETEAIDYLLLCGAEKTGSKTIIKKNGWSGLKACSAMDYLKKLNYTVKLENADVPKKKKLKTTRKAGDSITGVCIFIPEELWYNNSRRIA